MSCRIAPQAYTAKFLQQREEDKAATLAAARAEDQKIKQYWSMVSEASGQASGLLAFLHTRCLRCSSVCTTCLQLACVPRRHTSCNVAVRQLKPLHML